MIALGLFPPSTAPDEPAPAAARDVAWRRVTRWAAAVSLLPIPVWFIGSALLSPAPAWRATYREGADWGGPGVVVHERELQRYWDKSNTKVPGGLSFKHFAARWDACLELREARDVPLLLAADGVASLEVDGNERLRAESARGQRVTRGETMRLEAGIHHLQVQLEPRGWPSVALLASFDGNVPRAIASGEIVAGVRVTPPRDGPAPCPEH